MAQKKFVGEVIKKNGKTIVVRIERFLKNEKYGKSLKIFKTMQAHDQNEATEIGDFIEIVETKPVSKTKAFSFNRVIK